MTRSAAAAGESTALEAMVRTSSDTVCRSVQVRPGMCGHNASLVGQIGDWAWDAVSELTGVDVLAARTENDNPAYLSFYYYDIVGDPGFHLLSPTFGDRLQVVSRAFDFGSESVLILQRISDLGPGHLPLLPTSEFFVDRRPGCLYVQNFNRWVTRAAGDNEQLASAAPVGFDPSGLGTLPERFSPRRIYAPARRAGRFVAAGWPEPTDRWDFPYVVSEARDLNGVGLLYFASYFSIFNEALASVWRTLGRSATSFMHRVGVRHQICFLGNANAQTRLVATVERAEKSAAERFDIVLRAEEDNRVLAVAAIELLRDCPGSVADGSDRQMGDDNGNR